VNFVDALFVQGKYQIRPPVPFVPGSEVSGEVIEVGRDVDGWQVGDRAVASVGLGGYASEVVVHAAALVRVPDTLTFGQAATMGQSYATAWFALTRRTTISEGEWLVALGAAGGVGLAMIDVARALGAQTVAAASDDAKVQLCIQRGAHKVVPYGLEPNPSEVKDAIRAATNGGADVVIDTVGGVLAEAGLRSLRENGRLVVVGFATGTIPALPANQILLRNRTVVGVDWGAWALGNPADNAALMAEVMELAADGRISPIEPAARPLEDAGAVLRELLDRKITGKVCLEPSPVPAGS
jgi:NADPH2:quinone reductase